MARLLLHRGAYVDTTNDFGVTADFRTMVLNYAHDHPEVEVVQLTLGARSDAAVYDIRYQTHVHHCLRISACNSRQEPLAMPLRKPVQLDVRDLT